ncbi:MAG: hypothetical protein RL042_1782 [Nitrospirota bacterium]
MARLLRVLLIEDSEDDALLLERELTRGGYAPLVTRVDEPGAMHAALRDQTWDCVLADWNLPRFSALFALEMLKSQGLDLPFIIVSGAIGEEAATSAMRASAHDFVRKQQPERLVLTVERELREANDRRARKQAEAALAASQDQVRQMQKMEALGQLAGGIAHDFNNLLTAILGYTELAGTKLAADHPSRPHLARIREAGDRASHLVQQILAFTHQQPLTRTVLSLAPVVTEVLALLRATLPASIELTSSEVAGTPPVLADATQIHQVLMNLCTNAWHALGQEKGSITVELAPVTLTQALIASQATLPPGHYARLSVRDTGHGMAPETVARIFDPFFTTKPVGHGTGLGLSVVHGIIKKHDGAIVVDSQPGQGTTFHLYMPAVEVATQTEEPGEEATPVPRQGRSRHLLYLDDEEMLVELVRARFESLGYRVTGCTRPTEALDLVRANPGGVDVVVTDYNMPGLSGLEVARTLSQLRADLPVVLVSGYLSPDAQTEALAAGIRQIIYKPTLLQHLGDVIARLLDAPSQGLPPLITGENPSTHRAQ